MRLRISPYIVVSRHIKDRTSKGEIIARCNTKESAEELAKSYSHPDYNYWAMSRNQYDNPFSE